ncbi:MAG: hypothetical protein MJ252_17630 [archaeon]|nr:hypothetical protein [archaeon]
MSSKMKDKRNKLPPIKSPNHIKNAREMGRAMTYQDEKELEQHKDKAEEQLELMTQFMLDPSSSATTLLEKRREMYELQEALQKDKEKFKEKASQFQKTEEELHCRDEEFHKQICDYYKNVYLKIQKQGDANTKAKELNEDLTILRTKKKRKEQKLLTNEADLEKLKEIQKKLKVYEKYLVQVREKHPDRFPDVNSIMDNFKVLETNKKNTENQIKEIIKEKEKGIQAFREKRTELEKKINKKLNDINDLQEQIKDLKEKKRNIDNETARMDANSNQISLSLETILLAVKNIYAKCKETEWTAHGTNTEFMLDDKCSDYSMKVEEAKKKIEYIKRYIEDFKDIYEKFQEEKRNPQLTKKKLLKNKELSYKI